MGWEYARRRPPGGDLWWPDNSKKSTVTKVSIRLASSTRRPPPHHIFQTPLTTTTMPNNFQGRMSDFNKGQIIAFRRKILSLSQIAKELKRPKSTMQTFLDRYENRDSRKHSFRRQTSTDHRPHAKTSCRRLDDYLFANDQRGCSQCIRAYQRAGTHRGHQKVEGEAEGAPD